MGSKFDKQQGVKWVKLKRYCELTGDSAMAVHKRRGQGVWLDGKHTKIAGDGRLWVNLDAASDWVETSAPDSKAGAVQ